MIKLCYVHTDEDFKCSPVKNIEFEIIDEANIDELLEEVDRFIRAVGYYPRGTLQYVREEESDESNKR